MFKKVESWVVALICVIFLIILIGYGAAVRNALTGGRYKILHQPALFLAEIPSNLRRILVGAKNPGRDMVVLNDTRHANKPRFRRFKEAERNELLLLSRYDRDLKRSLVEIIDMKDFSVLHTYRPDINEINETTDITSGGPGEFKDLLRDKAPDRYQMYNPLVTSQGELLFQSMGSPLVKIDFCSNLVWVNDVDNFHHSINVDHEGNYWVPAHRFPSALDKKLVGTQFGQFLDDAITKVSPDGKILYQKSVSELLLENNYKHLIFSNPGQIKDSIHLNDIEPVLEDGPYWEKGDVFVSLRSLSMIIHLRPSKNEIIRTITGEFFNQHDVDIISSREISIFNNNAVFTAANGRIILGNSEILVYNFERQQLSKLFDNSMRTYEVRTQYGGAADILADGSLMVEETNGGRLLLFDFKGDLEWEFVNIGGDGKVYDVAWSRIIDDRTLIEQLRLKIEGNQCVN